MADNNEAKELWKKIKDIPPFIASIIAVLAACAGIITWIVGYFATQAQLNDARCISEININMLSKQMYSLINYDDYIKKKKDILELTKRKNQDILNFTSDDEEKLIDLNAKAEIQLRAVEKAKVEVDWLLNILKTGKLFTASGECRSTKER